MGGGGGVKSNCKQPSGNWGGGGKCRCGISLFLEGSVFKPDSSSSPRVEKRRANSI